MNTKTNAPLYFKEVLRDLMFAGSYVGSTVLKAADMIASSSVQLILFFMLFVHTKNIREVVEVLKAGACGKAGLITPVGNKTYNITQVIYPQHISGIFLTSIL